MAIGVATIWFFFYCSYHGFTYFLVSFFLDIQLFPLVFLDCFNIDVFSVFSFLLLIATIIFLMLIAIYALYQQLVNSLQVRCNRCLFLHIIFYWSTATFICLCVVCGGFRAAMTELSI